MNDDWQCADIWHMGTLVAEKVQLRGDATEYSLKALRLVQQRVQYQMDALQVNVAQLTLHPVPLRAAAAA